MNHNQIAYSKLASGCNAEKAGDFILAVNEYSCGLDHPVDDFDTMYFLNNNLGYSLIQLGKYAKAEEYCRKAIAIDSTKYNAHKNLGLAHQGQGQYLEAAKSLDLAAVMSKDPRARKHLEDLLAEHPEIKASFRPIKIVKEGLYNVHSRSRMVH